MNKYRILLIGFFLTSAFFTSEAEAGIKPEASDFHLKDSVGVKREGSRFFIRHEVEEGEDVTGIARRYGVTSAEIVNLNEEAREQLYEGLILKIPVRNGDRTLHKKLRAYKVKPGDNLFRICKRFKVSVDETCEINELNNKQINVGQELLLKTPVVDAELYDLPSNAFAPASQPGASLIIKKHTVASGETLFSIAHKHGVRIDSLRAWNRLYTNDLKVGQSLTVGKRPDEGSTAWTDFINESSDTEIVQKNGVARKISLAGQKRLALHRTAPIDSYIRVYYEGRGTSVTVRVIGRIPKASENKKIIIILSEAACKDLGAINNQFPVLISYSEAKEED